MIKYSRLRITQSWVCSLLRFFSPNEQNLYKMPSKSNLKIPTCAQNVAEVTTPREIKFTAPIPSWLRGTLWFSGPGTFYLEKGSCKNWFDGFAITTKLEIGSESVKITSKHVQTVTYKKAVKAKHPVMAGMMHPPKNDENRGFFSKFIPFTPNDMTDNCVGVINKFSDSKLFVIADSSTVYEINPLNCSTQGHFNTQKVFGLNSICPEVIKDVRNGDLYVCGSAIKPTFHNIFVKMPLSNKGRRLEERFVQVGSIPSRWKFGPCGLRSSFAITEHYIIFVETPYIVNLMKVVATFAKSYKMIDWMDWVPEDKVRFYLMSKATGKVLKVEYLSVQAFLVLTIVNAYEENDKIILDLTIHTSPVIFEGFQLSNVRSLISPKDYVPGSLERFIIPIIPSDVRKLPENVSLLPSDAKGMAIRKGDRVILGGELMSKCLGYDLGVINPNFYSWPYSFAYGTCALPSTVSNLAGIRHGIAKLNLKDGHQLVWDAGPSHHPHKPVFIPNPEGVAGDEEDGVVVAVVSNLQKRQSDFLVVLDPRGMTEISRVEFKDCPVSSYYSPTWFFAQ